MKTLLFMMASLWTTFVFAICPGDKEIFLKKALKSLEGVETASYNEDTKNWMFGDTLGQEYHRILKEFNNAADTTIGVSFVWWDASDTTLVQGCYDGTLKATTWAEDKVVILDDFTTQKQPVRFITPPFFNHAKSIVRYILNTQDSISVEFRELEESYHLRLTIHEDKFVEFFGKPYHMPESPYSIDDPTSVYELWFNKSDLLPYKERTEMSYNISESTCSNVEINKSQIKSIQVADYLPKGYAVRMKGEKRDKSPAPSLLGKQAPSWTLNDANDQSVSLSGLKSKVVVLNFTGIGCGPCVLSIPFLNSIKELFPAGDCEVVSVESWKNKTHSLRVYRDKNRIDYTFLEGNDAIIKDYLDGKRGVPVFFILDAKRNVRKIIHGYNKETTGEEILKAVKEALSAT